MVQESSTCINDQRNLLLFGNSNKYHQVHTSGFVHFLSGHHGGHCGVCPVVDDQILKHQEEMTNGVRAQLMIGGADGSRECRLRTAVSVRQLVEVCTQDEPGALPGKGKHTGYIGWEHSLGKGNTQDVQVRSTPRERETHRLYRFGALPGKG